MTLARVDPLVGEMLNDVAVSTYLLAVLMYMLVALPPVKRYRDGAGTERCL